jgi:hypothetical protein
MAKRNTAVRVGTGWAGGRVHAWERAGEARASGKIKRFNMFDTWVQAAPAILKFLDG